MSEGYINLYENDDKSGNRPHFKATFKIGDVWHEAALWPARDGKKGFSGKYKIQEKRIPKEAQEGIKQLQRTVSTLDDEIPF